jgi:hypothetical protein
MQNALSFKQRLLVQTNATRPSNPADLSICCQQQMTDEEMIHRSKSARKAKAIITLEGVL